MSVESIARVRARPKADLHCHALLSAPRSAYIELGSQVAPLATQYGGWDAFDTAIGRDFISVVRSLSDFKSIITAAYRHMIDDGIVYAEPSFDLALPKLLNCELEQILGVIDDCTRRVAAELQVRPHFGLIRTLPLAAQMQYADAFADSGLFYGVDLYGDERAGELRDFLPLFKLADARGLSKKAHTGEFCGPPSIEAAIVCYELDQLQHGVRAIESDATQRLILDRGIELNLCIESNISLAVAPSRALHPIAELHRKGILVTVNSDDLALFGVPLSEDLARLHETGLNVAEVDAVIARGLRRHTGVSAPSRPQS